MTRARFSKYTTTAARYLTNCYRGRAVTLEKLDRLSEAARDWGGAVDWEIGADRLFFQICRAKCLAHVDPAKAVAAAKEMMQTGPNNLEISLQYAYILLVAGDKEEYKRLCDRQLEHGPTLACFNEPGRHDYLLARLCLLAGDDGDNVTAPANSKGSGVFD